MKWDRPTYWSQKKIQAEDRFDFIYTGLGGW